MQSGCCLDLREGPSVRWTGGYCEAEVSGHEEPPGHNQNLDTTLQADHEGTVRRVQGEVDDRRHSSTWSSEFADAEAGDADGGGIRDSESPMRGMGETHNRMLAGRYRKIDMRHRATMVQSLLEHTGGN